MRFGVLGSLEVIDDDGRQRDVTGTQLRTVLAALLLASGRVVSSDALITSIWGEAPPRSAVGTLQSYVSRLRRAIESDGEARLLFEPPGYRLVTSTDEVDFRRFEQLADEGAALLAQGSAAEARAVLLEADRLWRGPALAECRDLEFARGAAARLDARRLAAIEDRIAAELALGRHAAVVGELAQLAADHPYQEGLRAAQALALYRSGRQADALRVLDEARRTLRDDLGVTLSRPLVELESRILAQDPALDAPARATSGPTAAAAASPEPAPSDEGADDGDRIVGRDDELAVLSGLLAEAVAGLRVGVVEGEPGIGKTRLVEEVGREAARRGAVVLWGRAFEGGAAPAFWQWLPVLRALAEAAPEGFTVPPSLATVLAPTGDPTGVAAVEPARFAMVDATVALLAASARVRPLVIVLDDLQWADAASLELLSAVTSASAGTPMLVLVTVRELELGRADAVVDALAGLSRLPGTRRLRLRGLSPAQADLLLQRAAGRSVDAATSAAVRNRAEGNPFFIRELGRLIADGGLADVPAGVRDVVRRRLALLPPETVEVLRVASVIGRDVDLDLLTAASGMEIDACLDGLEPALLQRLLVPVAARPGAYRFSHALVREVLIDDLSPLRAARLHLRVADAIEETDDTVEILAEHLWQAVPLGVGARAAAALERAGKVAIRRVAWSTAEALLERAVQLRQATSSSPADVDAELRSLGLLLGVIGVRRGYSARTSSPVLARAKRLAQETGRLDELMVLLWVDWSTLDLACRFDQSLPVARELLKLAEEHDRPLARLLGHSAYGITCWHLGRIGEAARHMDIAGEACRAFARSDERSVLFDLDQSRLALPFGAYLHQLRGELVDIEGTYDEIVSLFPDEPYWELVVMNFAASGALSTGDLERCLAAARRGMVTDPEGSAAFWAQALRCYLGCALVLTGEVDEGEALFHDAWPVYSGGGPRTNSTSWWASRCIGLARAGRLGDAQQALDDGRHELEAYGELYAEPLLLLAEAVLAHARGAGPADLQPLVEQAVALSDANGSPAMTARIRRDAAALGLDI